MGKNVARITLGTLVLVAVILVAFIFGRDSADRDGTSPTDTPGPTSTPAPDSDDDAVDSPTGTPTVSPTPTDDGPLLVPSEALPAGANTCGIELYSLTLPSGWYHDSACKRFSRQQIEAGATFTEVDLAWTLLETFEEAVTRVTATPGTWEVLTSQDRTVADRRAKWLAVELGPDSERKGYQHLILIDLEDGVLFLAASSEAADAARPNDFDLNSSAMETLVGSLVLHGRDEG